MASLKGEFQENGDLALFLRAPAGMRRGLGATGIACTIRYRDGEAEGRAVFSPLAEGGRSAILPVD